MRQSVLVTGGVGYVGRELVRQLIAEDQFQVHVLDSLACGENRLEQMDGNKFVLHRCDIRDAAGVTRVMQALSPEIVFHLAAIHYIPACEAAPGDAVSINVGGTVNLLDAAAPKTKFVFASTAAVYRPGADSHIELDETLGPVDIYGHTKLQGEHFVRYYHSQRKVHGVIVRLFNVVGPGETNPHLVPTIVKQVGAGLREVRLGNLFPHRDYVDVADAARGFRLLAQLDTCLTISNLGTGITHSVEDVVRLIGAAAAVELDIIQDSERVRTIDRPMLRASTDKLRSLIGWVPETTLAQSMRRAWSARFVDRLV